MLKLMAITSSILFITLILVGCTQQNNNNYELTFIAESDSMYPAIKSGDTLIYEKIQNKDEITTWKEANDSGNYKKFSDYGDVIIYYPYGDNNSDEIAHRAMCWINVEYNGPNKTYSIDKYGLNQINADEPLFIPEIGIMNSNNQPIMVNWENSGFITKGDNPTTNYVCDQVGGVCDNPIKVEWILGKVTGLK